MATHTIYSTATVAYITYNKIQYNAIKYNTIQYNTILTPLLLDTTIATIHYAVQY